MQGKDHEPSGKRRGPMTQCAWSVCWCHRQLHTCKRILRFRAVLKTLSPTHRRIVSELGLDLQRKDEEKCSHGSVQGYESEKDQMAHGSSQNCCWRPFFPLRTSCDSARNFLSHFGAPMNNRMDTGASQPPPVSPQEAWDSLGNNNGHSASSSPIGAVLWTRLQFY